MRFFPFPDKTACIEELKRDKYYDRIPEEDRQRILHDAWQRGELAAREFFAAGPVTVFQAMEQEGLEIERTDRDMVVGGTRYFAEIYVKTKKVILYPPSIALWAEHNSLTEAQAEELILAHEYFHYLEHTVLPPAGSTYRVPAVQLFGRTLMYAGLSSVSEIGAHSFARAYFQRIMQP